MTFARLALVIAVSLVCTFPCRRSSQRPPECPAKKPEVAPRSRCSSAGLRLRVAQREQRACPRDCLRSDLIWAKGYVHADVDRRVPATPATIIG